MFSTERNIKNGHFLSHGNTKDMLEDPSSTEDYAETDPLQPEGETVAQDFQTKQYNGVTFDASSLIQSSLPPSPKHFHKDVEEVSIHIEPVGDAAQKKKVKDAHITIANESSTSNHGKTSKNSLRQVSSRSSDDSENGPRHGIRRSRSYVGAPDGGWGWVVVFASFMISLIADGISFSFGIIFLELSDYFNESKGKTAVAASLFMSIPLLVGPVASALVERYSCRRVTIASGLISCFGFALGFFATSIEYLYVVFSIAGMGLALSYVTSIVIVAYYFEKYRSLATGIAVSGTGLGTFIFAPLTTYLMEEYGWRGTLLIMSGFFLNICVCGALMRDLPEEDDDESEDSSPPNEKLHPSPNQLAITDTKLKLPLLDRQSSHHLSGHPPSPHLLTPTPIRMSSSLVNIPTYLSHRGSALDDGEVINEISIRKGGYLSRLLQRYPQLLSIMFSGRNDRVFGTQHQTSFSVKGPKVLPPTSILGDVIKDTKDSTPASTSSIGKTNLTDGQVRSPLSANPITIRSPKSVGKTVTAIPMSKRVNSIIPFEYGSQARKVQRGSITYRSAMLNIRQRPHRTRASSCPDIVTVTGSQSEIPTSWKEAFKEFWCDIFDVSIFKSWKYSLFCFSNLLLYACIDVPYVYIPDHAITSGASGKEEASFLISLIGMINTAGIVLVGYVGNKTWISPTLLYSGLILFSGLSIFFIPILSSYEFLALLSSIYALTVSANYVLTSIILVDLISLDKFTIGYGNLLLVQGAASLVGPPFAGWLCDITSSYDLTFYATGLCIIVSGIVVLPVASRSGSSVSVLIRQEETESETERPSDLKVTIQAPHNGVCSSDLPFPRDS